MLLVSLCLPSFPCVSRCLHCFFHVPLTVWGLRWCNSLPRKAPNDPEELKKVTGLWYIWSHFLRSASVEHGHSVSLDFAAEGLLVWCCRLLMQRGCLFATTLKVVFTGEGGLSTICCVCVCVCVCRSCRNSQELEDACSRFPRPISTLSPVCCISLPGAMGRQSASQKLVHSGLYLRSRKQVHVNPLAQS